MRTLAEVRLDSGDDLKPGDKVLCSTFQEQDHVDVVGLSKGKGFAGVVRRHHFRGGVATHGSMFHRLPGSIGPSAFPSRVFPGTRSSGRLGGRQATAKNLVVLRVDLEKNLLYIKGAVPGARNSILKIVRSSFVRAAAR
jgi:large subunit ribosomal protein L3